MDWRRYWFAPKSSTAEHRRQQFIAATRIYAHFISLPFSEFPINLSSKEMKRLYAIFENAAKTIYGRPRGSVSSSTSDDVTPFDNILPDDASDCPINGKSRADMTAIELRGSVNLNALGRANLRAVSRMNDVNIDEVLADIQIPDAFNEMIFDAAESEIKYLVLTNTWPKFVNMGRANSLLSQESDAEKGNVWIRRMLCDRGS